MALNRHFGGTYMAFLVLEGRNQNVATVSAVKRITNDLMHFGNTIAQAYPAAPALAEKLSQRLVLTPAEETTIPTLLDATIDYGDQISAAATDEAYSAMQELQAFLGVEKEKRKVFKQPATLAYMAGLQAHLEGLGLIGKSHSIADVVRKVNQELTDGKLENFRIPDKLQSVSECC